MKEDTIGEQLDELKKQTTNQKVILGSMFNQKIFAGLILGISILLMIIDDFLKMDYLIGGWHIVIYLLLLVPITYLAWKKELANPYVKWFIPLLVVFVIDMFYYANNMTQTFLPMAFYLMVALLYITSTHKVHSLYQTFIPYFSFVGVGFGYATKLFDLLFVKSDNLQLYKRIGLALAITLPFLVLFVALLFSADKNFGDFLTNLVNFHFSFDMQHIFFMPLYLFAYLIFFTTTLSNVKNRSNIKETKGFDLLIVGIFLSMINLLFLLFIVMQLPFLFGDAQLPSNMTLAEFAREGFFQLMMVMGLVVLIFIFIMRRFKGEKLLMFLLSGLLVQTILMGVVSLKKMYLYQSIKGATVLRYYVEWFDYFLIVVLAVGLLFFLRKMSFTKLLDMVVVLGLLTFTFIVSLNVDAMVASHNIEKFKENPKELDKKALSKLSVDALPSIQGTDIVLLKSRIGRDCSRFAEYHFGYCSNIAKYGESQYKPYQDMKDYYIDASSAFVYEDEKGRIDGRAK